MDCLKDFNPIKDGRSSSDTVMIDNIKNHFEKISSLINNISIPIEEEGNSERFHNIEAYLSSSLDDDLKLLIETFQGLGFEDKVGFAAPCKIPVLGESSIIEFGVFLTLQNSPYEIQCLLESNVDLFGKEYLPIAEATPGDFIALHLKNKKIYFISHDFDAKTEESHFEIAKTLDSYLLGLKQFPEQPANKIEEDPSKIVKVNYSSNLLKMAERFKKDNK